LFIQNYKSLVETAGDSFRTMSWFMLPLKAPACTSNSPTWGSASQAKMISLWTKVAFSKWMFIPSTINPGRSLVEMPELVQCFTIRNCGLSLRHKPRKPGLTINMGENVMLKKFLAIASFIAVGLFSQDSTADDCHKYSHDSDIGKLCTTDNGRPGKCHRLRPGGHSLTCKVVYKSQEEVVVFPYF